MRLRSRRCRGFVGSGGLTRKGASKAMSHCETAPDHHLALSKETLEDACRRWTRRCAKGWVCLRCVCRYVPPFGPSSASVRLGAPGCCSRGSRGVYSRRRPGGQGSAGVRPERRGRWLYDGESLPPKREALSVSFPSGARQAINAVVVHKPGARPMSRAFPDKALLSSRPRAPRSRGSGRRAAGRPCRRALADRAVHTGL